MAPAPSLGLLALLALVSAGCMVTPIVPLLTDDPGSAGRPVPAAEAPAPDLCAEAQKERGRVPVLRAAGRLDRALRVIRRANELCPAQASLSLAAESELLAELGLRQELTEVARRMKGLPSAGAETMALVQPGPTKADELEGLGSDMDNASRMARARELYYEAGKAQLGGDYGKAYELYVSSVAAWPTGNALAQAGLMANRLGQTVEAQRLFDRAVVALERARGQKLELDTPNGFSSGAVRAAWHGSSIAVAHGSLVSIVDVGTLREAQQLDSGSWVLSVALSPDGKKLAAGLADLTIRLWDAGTGKELARLEGHDDVADAVAFSLDGELLASGARDSTVRLWDVKSDDEVKPLATLEGHSSHIRSVAFSPDRRLLASGSEDQTIRLWSVNSGKLLKTFEGHTNWVSSVMFSKDQRTLASGGWDNTVRLWDVRTGRQLHKLEGHSDNVTSVMFSPDGKMLASGSWDGSVRLWDVQGGKHLDTPMEHGEWVHSVMFSPDGNTLASGSWDGSVRLWDVRGHKQHATLERHSEGVRAVAFSPDGRTLATGSNDHTIRLWDIGGGSSLVRLVGQGDAVTALRFSSDGELIASGSGRSFESRGATLRLWHAHTRALLATFPGHREAVLSIAFSPGGELIASSSQDHTVRLWNVSLKMPSQVLGAPEECFHSQHDVACTAGAVFSVAFLDRETLAAASGDPIVQLWNVGTRKRLGKLKGRSEDVISAAFSPDGEILASGSEDETVRLWDVRSGKQLAKLEGHTGDVTSVVFSPDGRILASGSLDRTVRLWDAGTQKPLATLEGHCDEVTAMTFSPDGEILASASDDGTVVLWRSSDRSRIAALRALRDADAGYVFTPDGYIEFIGSEADKARSYPLCRIGQRSFPFELCRERFEVPGLLGKVIAGDTSYRDP